MMQHQSAMLRRPLGLTSLPRPGPRNCAISTRTNSRVAVRAHATVPLTIFVNYETKVGESIKAVGNVAELGDWDVNKGAALKWNEGHVWNLTTKVPVGEEVNFKLVMNSKSDEVWEEGSTNRTLKALGPDYGLTAVCEWNKTRKTRIEAYEISEEGTANAIAAATADSLTGGNGRTKSSSSSSKSSSSGSSSSKDNSSTGSLSSFEESARSATNSSWVGGDVEFVQQRKDKTERQGKWNTEGLEEGAVMDLVKGDEHSSNWLSKLDLMKDLLVNKPDKMRPGQDAMAVCYIYATWVNNGAIMSVESGRHNRPNHHAHCAMEMFRSLEWVISDALQDTAPGADSKTRAAAEARVLAARRMHSRLPSFSGEFRQSVPLTRIRDIAHRNDMPQDIKQEIKHTLQNKLHRCAGPEDLVATEKMLKRLTQNPGEFNDSFVNEFKIFTKELREFFNATGLRELLESMQSDVDESHGSAVGQFLHIMSQVEGTGEGTRIEDLMALLQAGTQARTLYVRGLSAGLRNDVTDDVLAQRQRWRLADIRLEEFNFVVLSRVINTLEAEGGAQMLSKAGNKEWGIPMSAMTAGLRNMGLGQYGPRELFALENELQAWHTAGPFTEGMENALRGKASVERVLRIANEYGDAVMDVYADKAAKIGDALGMPEYMSRIFGEGEIRASVAFQVSKLATMLTKAFRLAANMNAWDGLVTGTSVGILKQVDSLGPDAMEGATDEGVVLLVKAAEGDEELGPLGQRLRGVVLTQELPHLSHLGVRARQEQVTFATCDDQDYVTSTVKPLLGKMVKLTVTQEGVELVEASAADISDAAKGSKGSEVAAGSPNGSKPYSPSPIKRVNAPELVPLLEANDANCGAKAAKCAELEVMAKSSKGLFKTPVGCCLPFGSMDVAIKAAGKTQDYTAILKQLEDGGLNGAPLDAACDSMQKLLRAIPVDATLVGKISSTFSPSTLLAVRSSANVEDLAGMSAAGLYESVVGVKASESAEVTAAVTDVWASLYTRRAVLSRRAAGVPQADASMAVLIQHLYVPDVSFVLHTARPTDGDTNTLMAEAAPGQGETLAAATRGTPWRFEYNKTSGKVETLAFANFSRALVLAPKGMTMAEGARKGLAELEVDYSKKRLSADADYRNEVVTQMAKVGVLIESHFDGTAQDIEGGMVDVPDSSSDREIFVFQTRPQH